MLVRCNNNNKRCRAVYIVRRNFFDTFKVIFNKIRFRDLPLLNLTDYLFDSIIFHRLSNLFRCRMIQHRAITGNNVCIAG